MDLFLISARNSGVHFGLQPSAFFLAQVAFSVASCLALASSGIFQPIAFLVADLFAKDSRDMVLPLFELEIFAR